MLSVARSKTDGEPVCVRESVCERECVCKREGEINERVSLVIYI